MSWQQTVNTLGVIMWSIGNVKLALGEIMTMDFDLAAAVVGGLVGTAVMTVLMSMAPMMGMPRMDMPALLGSMFGALSCG